ncbi:unnamed protein product [Pylaiella littoralis]
MSTAATCAPAPMAGLHRYSPQAEGGWRQHHNVQQQRQQQQQQQQHLVEFQGRTLCVSASSSYASSNSSKASCVLEAVFLALGVSRGAAESLSVPWRLQCGGRFLSPDHDVPPLSILRVWTGGLKGGKGGFGAMLRAMAKQAGAKPTTDFGACRDLQGRRLRHVNDEVRLQKWQEDRERESRGEKVEEQKTQSGIENWHLGVPTWAEGAKPSYMKSRRKTVICQQWLDARKDRKAPQGAPPWWGCPRGRGCDFAHGKDELRGKGLEEFNQQDKKQKLEKRQFGLDQYLESSSAEPVTLAMPSAVEQGLKAAARAGVKKAAESAEDARGLLRLDLQGGEAGEKGSLGCSWMEVAGGDVGLTEEGRAQGASEFGTARVVGVALRKKAWYLEVTLLTAGLMQIGWADHTFVPGGPESGDGIGDVPGSWAYDGVRQQRWNEGSSEYGEAWKVGDVVGCLLEINGAAQTASMSFTLNGKDMGVAFDGVKLAPARKATDKVALEGEPGFFPALSLEEGEAVTVNLGQAPFVHAPPGVSKAVIAARAGGGGAAVAQPRLTVAVTAEGEGEDGEDGGPRVPVDLEEFSCATDLAARFGPNRLKEELESKGVKCGGTHYQRAARLFSLKRVAPEDYPKNLLAKKAKKS